MRNAILLFASLLSIFFATRMSVGTEHRSFWVAAATTVEDLNVLTLHQQLRKP